MKPLTVGEVLASMKVESKSTRTFNGKGCTVEKKQRPWWYKGRTFWRWVAIVTYEDDTKETMPWKKFQEKAFIRHQEQPNAAKLLAKMLKGKI